MAEIKLPTKKRKAVATTPKRLIIFSKPKIGKSIITSMLPKCLMLDFEKGTLNIDAMAIQVKKFSDIDEICKKIKEAKYPYQFIAIDTVSSLEEMCIEEAERRYSLTPEGKNWFRRDPDDKTKYHEKSGKMQKGSILNLEWGKGYQMVSDIFNEAIMKIEKHTPKTILLAHSTYSTIEKEGSELTTIDIQLGKKSKFMATFKADAIGYMYRKENQNIIDFCANGDDVTAGGRLRYLEKEPFVISEFVSDGKGGETLKTYWEKIYAPDKKPSAKKKTEEKKPETKSK